MSYGDPSSNPNPFSPNPYQSPSNPGYMAPPPSSGTDVAMVLGIISLVFGFIALPLSCCVCIGIFPGGLAIILGVVALMMPMQPGSPGKPLAIGGIVLGIVPFIWFAISLVLGAMNPNPGFRNNQNPFNIDAPAIPGEENK